MIDLEDFLAGFDDIVLNINIKIRVTENNNCY